MNIELSSNEATYLVSCLSGLSDRLTKEHEASFSGVEQLLIMSAIQEVDRLYQSIKEQVEAQREVVEVKEIHIPEA